MCRIWSSCSGSFERIYLQGYNTMQSAESQLMFCRNVFRAKQAVWKRCSLNIPWPATIKFLAHTMILPSN
jgi:hypothetical protein